MRYFIFILFCILCFVFINGHTSRSFAATYLNGYTGDLYGDNNTVKGGVKGNVYGNHNNIDGGVTGHLDGYYNTVTNGGVGGCLVGDSNQVANGVSYDVRGNNNYVSAGGVVGHVVGTGNTVFGGIKNSTVPACPTPLPTPTPTLAPTVIPTATPFPTPTSIPTTPAGNILNLNFGVTNQLPWIQVACGDIRLDSGIANPAPAGQYTSITNSSCDTPGIIYTGATNANFGSGQASSSNQVVGGTSFPEVYTSGNHGIFSTYDNLATKAVTSTTGITDLASICTLSSCTLPSNLPHGIYRANGDVTMNAYTFPAGQNYVFLINGNFTIAGNLITPAGSSVLFSVSGNIIVLPTVGSAANVATANLSGIFSTDKSFIMPTAGNCNDLRLNIEGSIIVNAARTGGTLQNNRDLCGGDQTSPTLSLTQRLDFVLNLPDFVKETSVTSQEVAP